MTAGNELASLDEVLTYRHPGTIRRYLTLRVPELGIATSYLSAYDGVAGDRWSELGIALETVAHAPPTKHQLVRAANQGFRAFCEWFDGGTALLSVGT